MKSPEKFKKFGLVLGIMFAPLILVLAYSLVQNKYTLTSVTGTILSQGHYHQAARARRGSLDAATIYINGYPNFGFRDGLTSAYAYLSNNNVTGRQATILYNAYGYDADPNLTFHVYELNIDGREIMTMSEAKRSDWINMAIFGTIELICIALYIYAKRKLNSRAQQLQWVISSL